MIAKHFFPQDQNDISYRVTKTKNKHVHTIFTSNNLSPPAVDWRGGSIPYNLFCSVYGASPVYSDRLLSLRLSGVYTITNSLGTATFGIAPCPGMYHPPEDTAGNPSRFDLG